MYMKISTILDDYFMKICNYNLTFSHHTFMRNLETPVKFSRPTLNTDRFKTTQIN